MVIDLVIVTAPKPPGSRQLISSMTRVFEMATANDGFAFAGNHLDAALVDVSYFVQFYDPGSIIEFVGNQIANADWITGAQCIPGMGRNNQCQRRIGAVQG
jgi:hypothetical protein